MIVNRKGGPAGAKYMTDEDEDIEEFRRHVDLIIEECHDIKSNSTIDTKHVFQHSIEFLDSQIDYIRKNELRINNNNQTEIQKLNGITTTKKNIATELRSIID